MEIHIKDYKELLALHKSLMAAKFDDPAYRNELQGSSFTASLANKAFNLLVSTCNEENNYKEVKEWLEWQQADITRPETKLLIKRIQENKNWWAEADEKLKSKYITNFMAPLLLKTELEREIIESH